MPGRILVPGNTRPNSRPDRAAFNAMPVRRDRRSSVPPRNAVVIEHQSRVQVARVFLDDELVGARVRTPDDVTHRIAGTV